MWECCGSVEKVPTSNSSYKRTPNLVLIENNLSILPVNDGRAKHRIEVLQTKFVAAAEIVGVFASTLPDNLAHIILLCF